MGGDLTGMFAEWNIRCDVEAAAKVFASGINIRLGDFQITSKCVFTKMQWEKARSLSGNSALLTSMLEKWETDRPNVTPTMFDGLVASFLTEEFCTFQRYKIKVETGGDNRGCISLAASNSAVPGIFAADSVNVDGFMDYLFDKIVSLS